MLCCPADMSTGEAFWIVYESASVVKRHKAVSFGQTILSAMLLSLVGQAWLPWKLNDDRTCGSGFHPDSSCADCWCWCETIVWVRWIVLPSNWCDVLGCAVQRCPPIRHHLRSVESMIQFGWAEEMWCISTRWKRGWWAGCDAAVEEFHLVFGVVQRLVLRYAVDALRFAVKTCPMICHHCLVWVVGLYFERWLLSARLTRADLVTRIWWHVLI